MRERCKGSRVGSMGEVGGDEEGLKRPYGISQSVFPVPRTLLFDSAISHSVLFPVSRAILFDSAMSHSVLRQVPA